MRDDSRRLIGGVEAGGTKFVCALGRGSDANIIKRESFPTGDNPQDVLTNVAQWFRSQEEAHGKLDGIGIASFGPVSLHQESANYGQITSTPKPGWKNTDIVGFFEAAFPGLPIGFDTDVNGAGLAEHLWGSAQGLDDFLYITMGTGIGAGGMSGGRLLHGLVHPEMGHMLIPPLPDDSFEGACPYHGNCWEGLCAGPAILARTGIEASNLEASHHAWDSVTYYTGLALANLVVTLSPERIIIGGSVRKGGQLGQDAFFDRIRVHLRNALAGYIAHPVFSGDLNDYIVPPLLGDDAGVAGAIGLGKLALQAK